MAEDASLDDFLGDQGDDEPGQSDATEAETVDDSAAESETAGTVPESSTVDDGEMVDENGEDAEDGENSEDSADEEGGDDLTESPPVDDDGRVSPDTVDPAAATADWSPGGAPCAACGTIAEHRWRDERGMVCPDCKSW